LDPSIANDERFGLHLSITLVIVILSRRRRIWLKNYNITQTDRFFPEASSGFPRRACPEHAEGRESIKVCSRLDSRFHGNDKTQYIVVKYLLMLIFN